MKTKLIALSIASAFSMSANALTIAENENGDSMSLYGGAEIGGWVSNEAPKGAKHSSGYVDDSFATIGIKGQTGDFYAKFELDAERTPWTNENNMRVVIDKAYIGYNVAPNHSIEFGRTDTAYDHFDSLGDFSVNEAAEVSEAGDQDNTVKYQGQFESIKYGISYSSQGDDYEADFKPTYDKNGKLIAIEDKGSYVTDSRYGAVVNGYVGYFGKELTVLFGAETVDDRGEIYSLHTKYNVGDFALGGLYSYSDRLNSNKDSHTYVASGSYHFTDKLEGVSTFSYVDNESKDNDRWVTAGVNYKYARNVKLSAEAVTGGKAGTYAYAKAYYWF